MRCVCVGVWLGVGVWVGVWACGVAGVGCGCVDVDDEVCAWVWVWACRRGCVGVGVRPAVLACVSVCLHGHVLRAKCLRA